MANAHSPNTASISTSRPPALRAEIEALAHETRHALARNGRRDLALDLLARNAVALDGKHRGTAVHNLAKVLLTQGNLYNVMRRPRAALPRYEASLAISRRIGDAYVVAGATSGLGRAYT